jgi:RNA polymerase sigma-70 factor (ECF subfamily)
MRQTTVELPTSSGSGDEFRTALERELVELRPRLHRYCARMTGSVIDGEDVVQDTVVKALEASSRCDPVVRLDAWLFRVAHNAALDHLRRHVRTESAGAGDAVPALEEITEPDEVGTADTGLQTFMRLPASQRCVVILMDVLGYTLDEITAIIDASLPAVKSALHRGRKRLRELAREPEENPLPVLSEGERSLLRHYVERFNARDFDALRDLLSAEVRLDLVGRTQLKGAEAGRYFHNYASVHDWHFLVGVVDGRLAALAYDPRSASGTPQYFVLLHWSGRQIVTIRDFRYARYAMESASVRVLP